MNKFAKFYSALTAGALAWGAAVVVSASGPITAGEWVTAAGVAVTAVAVYAIPNG